MDRRSKNIISEDDYYSAAVVLASPALVAAAATVLVEYGEHPALRATRSSSLLRRVGRTFFVIFF